MNNPLDHGEGFDWDPRSEDVVRHQVAALDALRERCPVAHSERLGWSPLRHADVLALLHRPEVFSSHVSTHVAIPNGMDGAEHARYRAVVDRCFTVERVAQFEPELRRIAEVLIAELRKGPPPADVMSSLGLPFAALAQCGYLGWPAEVADALRVWAADSEQATRAGDRAELDRVAAAFDRIIVAELDRARTEVAEDPAGLGPPARTLTHDLLAERVDGRPLTDAELVSIVRNWTAGELGTIAAAVGIVVEFVARNPEVQELLRARADLRQTAMDEMLRLEPPLVANRRRPTRDVEVSGRQVPADARVTVLWPPVQRDPAVFPEPTEFRLDRDPADNLLYGRGPHYCPGEGLSRLELGVFLDVLLGALPPFRLAGDPVRANYPAGGFVEVRIDWSPPEAAPSGTSPAR